MQKFLTILAAASALAIFGATQTTSQENADHKLLIMETSSGEFLVYRAERVDHERALELYLQGVVFVDVRNEWKFNIAHVRGAIGLELDSQFSEESLAKHVAKDQPVVFYCDRASCARSANASAMALTWGYTNVHYFADGWYAWSGNNYDQD